MLLSSRVTPASASRLAPADRFAASVSKLFDRKKLAAHWLAKHDWFDDELVRTCQIEADLKVSHISVPTSVSEASVTLMSIVEVCQDYYELYA
jgi:hypothetical protein